MEALTLMSKTLARRIASKAMRRNASLPINHLPIEILTEIFDLAAYLNSRSPLYPHATHIVQVIRLRRVSTIWRALVDNTSRLWVVIDFMAPPEVIQMGLQISKNRPLIITYLFNQRPGVAIPSISASYLSLSRCADAIVNVSSQADINMLSKNPAQLLKPLKILYSGSRELLELTSPVDIFGGQAPKLHHLDVSHLPVVWTSNIFTGLKSLIITYSHISPTTSQLYSLMTRCCQLESFKMDARGRPMTGDDQITANYAPFVLPQLIHLSLALPYPQLCNILALVQVPQCKSFSSFTAPPDYTVTTISNLLNLTKPFLDTYFSSWHNLQLEIDAAHFLVQCRIWKDFNPTPFVIHFDGLGVTPVVPLAWLVEELQRRSMSAHFSSIKFTTDSDVASIFPTLEKMMVTEVLVIAAGHWTQPSTGVRSIIARLSRPQPAIDGLQWPFKNLRALYVLSGPYSARALLQMLRGRYGVLPQEVPEAADLPLPVPLTSLIIYGGNAVSPLLRSLISTLVEGGGGQVYWRMDPVRVGADIEDGAEEDDDDDDQEWPEMGH